MVPSFATRSLTTQFHSPLTTALTRFALPGTDGVHTFLTFDSRVNASDVEAAAPGLDYVWGATAAHIPAYRKGNKDIVLSMYIPFARDPGCTAPADAAVDIGVPPNNLDWWLKNHPDWVMYTCDKKVAYSEGDCKFPHDITSPEVIAWQQKFVRQAAAAGYDAMACDNFQLDNSFLECGVYRYKKWVQLYNGNGQDPKFNADVITWLGNFTRAAHTVQSKQGRPMMVIPNSGGILPRAAFGPSYENLDGVLDEEGFTDWGQRLIKEEEFVALVQCVLHNMEHGLHLCAFILQLIINIIN